MILWLQVTGMRGHSDESWRPVQWDGYDGVVSVLTGPSVSTSSARTPVERTVRR